MLGAVCLASAGVEHGYLDQADFVTEKPKFELLHAINNRGKLLCCV